MPTLASTRLPPPKGWDEFQDIALSALKNRWKSPDLQHNGRNGQPQAGVDIYGSDDLGRRVGVQCKNSSDGLTLAEIREEIAKAETFVPPLQTLFVATTAMRDSKIQQAVRLLSGERVAQGLFPVAVIFWDDLIDDLAGDPTAFAKHYPQLAPRPVATIATTRRAGPTDEPIEVDVEDFYEPNLYVLKKPEKPHHSPQQADEWCSIRFFSPALAHRAFEPDEAQDFLRRVQQVFWEDSAAELEPALADGVIVQNRGADLNFHRRWGWWTRGVVGFAATLAFPSANAYSVADMVIDMVRAVEIVGALGVQGHSVVVVHVDPYRLAPDWRLSDGCLRGGQVGLAGVQQPGGASTAHRTATRWSYATELTGIGERAAQIVGSLVVQAMRKAHQPTVDSRDLIASIPGLIHTYRTV